MQFTGVREGFCLCKFQVCSYRCVRYANLFFYISLVPVVPVGLMVSLCLLVVQVLDFFIVTSRNLYSLCC